LARQHKAQEAVWHTGRAADDVEKTTPLLIKRYTKNDFTMDSHERIQWYFFNVI
jgi:hypothetical protein